MQPDNVEQRPPLSWGAMASGLRSVFAVRRYGFGVGDQGKLTRLVHVEKHGGRYRGRTNDEGGDLKNLLLWYQVGFRARRLGVKYGDRLAELRHGVDEIAFARGAGRIGARGHADIFPLQPGAVGGRAHAKINAHAGRVGFDAHQPMLQIGFGGG